MYVYIYLYIFLYEQFFIRPFVIKKYNFVLFINLYIFLQFWSIIFQIFNFFLRFP